MCPSHSSLRVRTRGYPKTMATTMPRSTTGFSRDEEVGRWLGMTQHFRVLISPHSDVPGPREGMDVGDDEQGVDHTGRRRKRFLPSVGGRAFFPECPHIESHDARTRRAHRDLQATVRRASQARRNSASTSDAVRTSLAEPAGVVNPGPSPSPPQALRQQTQISSSSPPNRGCTQQASPTTE